MSDGLTRAADELRLYGSNLTVKSVVVDAVDYEAVRCHVTVRGHVGATTRCFWLPRAYVTVAGQDAQSGWRIAAGPDLQSVVMPRWLAWKHGLVDRMAPSEAEAAFDRRHTRDLACDVCGWNSMSNAWLALSSVRPTSCVCPLVRLPAGVPTDDVVFERPPDVAVAHGGLVDSVRADAADAVRRSFGLPVRLLNLDECKVCGAPPDTKCTESCDRDDVPDAWVRTHPDARRLRHPISVSPVDGCYCGICRHDREALRRRNAPAETDEERNERLAARERHRRAESGPSASAAAPHVSRRAGVAVDDEATLADLLCEDAEPGGVS